MAATVKGTAHVYGISAGTGAVTNATVLSFNLTKEHANKAETINEEGNVIERRYDDLTQTGSITLRIRSAFTEAAAATDITYNTVKYTVESVERTEEAGGFTTVTYNIKTSANVSLA